jgi:hypothetical protein
VAHLPGPLLYLHQLLNYPDPGYKDVFSISPYEQSFKMAPATALIVNEIGGAWERTEVELDTLRPTEVLVKLKATGICHTDLAVRSGHIPMPFPVVLGHEGMFSA